jgi:dTDP-4-amino-4,6-dideoxygalactose transaminase
MPNWIVPYTNFGKEYLLQKKLYLKDFDKIMLSGDFILRKDVEIFETRLAKYLNIKHVIGVNSGTDALLLALGSMGFEKNSEIISVAHTYIATLAAISHIGCKPKLVDISEDFNINVNKIEQKINKKTRAIVPVHLNGRACDMDKILYLAKKYNLKIVEDAAQSLGAEFNNKKVGTFGDAGAFSLHPLKSLGAAGDGGFIATNNTKLANLLKRLRHHGQKNRSEIVHYGFCSRLDNLQASMLNIKFKKFNNMILRRRQIAKIYSKKLKNLPIILPKFDGKKNYDTFNSFVIKTHKRNSLKKFLIKNKIEVFINWPKPLYYFDKLKLDKKPLKETEKICKEILSLPIHPYLTQNQINYLVGKIKLFFKNEKNI